MTEIKFIRVNGDGYDKVKTFVDSPIYESLRVGNIVEVDCEDGQIRDYYVDKIEWNFGHFMNVLQITIKPVSK